MLDRSTQWILLPGLDGTGELFSPLIEALDEGAQTTVVRYIAERSFDDYVTTAASALPERGAIVIAESFSGPVALALAARHPTRIRRLALCATFARSPFRFLLRASQFAPMSFFGPNPTQRSVLRHFCFNNEVDEALLDRVVGILRSVPAITIRDRLNALASIDVRSLLHEICVPTLYLTASRDRIVSARLSNEVTNAVANTDKVTIEGPHLLLQARPHQCAAALKQFVSKL